MTTQSVVKVSVQSAMYGSEGTMSTSQSLRWVTAGPFSVLGLLDWALVHQHEIRVDVQHVPWLWPLATRFPECRKCA